MENCYITVPELSRKTKINAGTLYQWAREGRVPSYKVDGRVYVEDVSRSDLLYERICPECGKGFYTIHARQKFDKKICASRYIAREWYRRNRAVRK